MSAYPNDLEAVTLQRVIKQHRARRVAAWNVATGELYSESGNGAQLESDAPLSRVLNLIAGLTPALRPRTLFIIGGESAATTPRRSWWSEPAQLESAADGDGPWSYDGYELAAHAATGGRDEATENAGNYQRGDCRVDVRMSALWFAGVTSPRDFRDNWQCLNHALRRTFDDRATLLATPAMTGLDLLHRSLPAGARYPLAPLALRNQLYSSSGQGRFEFCPAPELAGQSVAGLWWLDARWMYAACVRGLPVGAPTHTDYPQGADSLEAYIPYRPAWYRVDVRVPEGWGHMGLIASRVAGETVYPAQPGEWLRDVWTSGSELAVALKNDWTCIIHERWAYRQESVPGLPDPTRFWIDRLRALREVYSSVPAVAGAIRHLVLDTVGMWHRQESWKLRITPIRDVPRSSDARVHHIDRAAGVASWYERKPLQRDQLAWQRPEWSATVWGRSRARENTAALAIPRGELVAYRSDAIVTCRQPEAASWLDDGQPGTFRRKGEIPGPLVMPATVGELLELRREQEAD